MKYYERKFCQTPLSIQNCAAVAKAKINDTGGWLSSRDSVRSIKPAAKRKLVLEERDRNKVLRESVLEKNYDCTDPSAILKNKK